MDYTKWSKRTFIIVMIGMAVLGFALAPKGSTQTITKEIPVEKIVTKEVVKEVQGKCDDSNWRTLKTIDDQAISYAAEGLGYCSQSFTAISDGDVKTLQSLITKMTDLTPKVNDLGTQRQAVLGRLGY